MGNELHGKKILLTGATSGIGERTTALLLEKGADMIITGRAENKLRQLKEESARQLLDIVADLSTPEGIQKIVSNCNNLDGIVLSAGLIDYSPLKFITEEKIDAIFGLNFKANVLLISRLVKERKIQKNSSIVIISSISSELAVPGTLLYAASKAAVKTAAKVMAAELIKQKIRVNTISPGLVDTKMASSSHAIMDDDARKELISKYPLGLGQTLDIASLISFLLSDASKWITGTDIVIDGGHTLNC